MYFGKELFVAPVFVLLMGGAAHAALTADQVWADLQTQAAGAGVKLTAATEVKGDGSLMLNGVTIAPDGGKGTATISQVSVVEEGDGSVTLYPQDIKFDFSPTAGSSSAVQISHDGLGITVREAGLGLGYGIMAKTLSVVVDEREENGSIGVAFRLEGLGGSYERGDAGISTHLTADRFAYAIAQENPTPGMNSKQTSDSAGLDVAVDVNFPSGLDLAALPFNQALRDGLGVSVKVLLGASEGTVEESNPDMPLNIAFTAQGGSTTLHLNRDTQAYDTQATDIAATLLPPMVPADILVSLSLFKLHFGMPVVALEPADYGIGLKLSDLVIGEGAWAVLDPGAALPRDPINVDLDLGGKVKIDFLDFMEVSENKTAPEGKPALQSLDIRILAISLAGAALSGTGAFTFDNSMVAVGGLPMPLGSADLRLEGGNRLIDGLVAIGLVPEDQAMGARMAMAMFGKPEGDDVVTSKFEAKEGGSVFVNGQQIQ